MLVRALSKSSKSWNATPDVRNANPETGCYIKLKDGVQHNPATRLTIGFLCN
jgi:hypothetical protein